MRRKEVTTDRPQVRVGQTYETKYGTFTVKRLGAAEGAIDVQQDNGRYARYALSDFETWILPPPRKA